jgi:hypothetical protein
MGDEVGQACSLHNLSEEAICDLLIKESNDFQRLKDEVTFAFPTKVLPHVIAMVDEINNLELNAILHGANIGNEVHLYNNLNQLFKHYAGKVAIEDPKIFNWV